MRKYILSIFAVLAVFGTGHYAKANTVYVTGTISSSTSWSPVNIYVINGNVTVNAGATLNIQAGTIVKFVSAVTLSITGTLNAQGSTTGTVYFTSIHDDIGGDTDATSITPRAGDWKQINLNSGASSTITYAVIRYSGNSNTAAIFNNNARLDLENSSITSTLWIAVQQQSTATATIASCDLTSSSTHTAVYISGGTATITSSTIHDNSRGIDASGSGSLTLTSNTFTNNASAAYVTLLGGLTFTHSGNTGQSGFYMVGPVATSQTWTADGLPYVISGVDFSVPSAKTLVISPGAAIKFSNASSKLTVSGANAVLRAIGTSASSIYFTSIHDDAADGNDTDGIVTSSKAGDWGRITVSTGASSTIAYAVIRYGGGSNGSLYTSSGNLTLSNAEVATSSQYGIYQDSGTSTVIGANIHNQPYGLNIQGGIVSVSSTQIGSNTTYGVYVVGGTVTVNTSPIYGSGTGVYVNGGTTNISACDIYSNTYGIWKQSGAVTISESAIDANTDHGIYNNTTNNITATNNWWNSTWGPSGSGSGSGDTITDHVNYSPWHHVNNPVSNSSVHGGEIRWDGSTTYTTLWANSRTTGNDEKTNEGGGVSVVDATSSTDLTVSDTSTLAFQWDGLYKPKSTNPVTTNDMLYVNIARIQSDGLSNDEIQHVLTHESGHALGLGHSANNDSNNIMASSTNSRISLGNDDKSDYHFLWVSLGWETLLLP